MPRGVYTYRQHVVNLLDRRLGVKDPLECSHEMKELLLCWGNIFTFKNAPFDPFKCKAQEEILFKCELAMTASSEVSN